jgi:hypothetical protein
MMVMLVLAHVSIALFSIFFSTYTFFVPSKLKIHVGQGLIAATLSSGTYLVISTHSNMLSACMSGLIYLAIVSFAIVSASKKLAIQENRD